jgi:hypothetical protein
MGIRSSQFGTILPTFADESGFKATDSSFGVYWFRLFVMLGSFFGTCGKGYPTG